MPCPYHVKYSLRSGLDRHTAYSIILNINQIKHTFMLYNAGYKQIWIA